MSASVLDSGALVALERNDRKMWAALKAAVRSGDIVMVPTTALAQVWRGTLRQARLSQALAHCSSSHFDPLARATGELCGRTRTADICDAHVALVAAAQGAFLYTSDPEDMKRLLAAIGGRPTVVIQC